MLSKTVSLALPILAIAQKTSFLGPFEATYPYAVHVPDAAATENQKWPIVVMLHGSGSKGGPSEVLDHAGWDGVGLLIRQGGENRSHVMARNDFVSFIPILPTTEQLWSADSVMSSFASFLSSPPAPLTVDSFDMSRVYASGYSLGGSGTWDLLRYYPANFSASIISSGGPIGLSSNDYKKIAEAGIDVWGFAGSNDKGTLESDVRNAIDAINKEGGNGTFTVIEGADHHVQSWSAWEYNDGESFDFLLANGKNGSEIVPPGTTSISLPTSVSGSQVSSLPTTTFSIPSVETDAPPIIITVTVSVFPTAS